jgi:S1-C subfamily serine protease
MASPVKFLPLVFLTAGLAAAEPFVVDDKKLINAFQTGIGAVADGEGHLSADDLAKAVKEAPSSVADLSLAEASPADPAAAVYMVGTVYKCGKCDAWHPGGIASAWALTRDGVMVSNYHVFEKATGAAMGVCDREGKTYPILEILAADKAADIAIFRVKADDLSPLALGTPAAIGSEIRVISHPDRRFFMQTAGEVSRYYQQPARKDSKPTVWMSITADYAKGSSGGPVIDDQGKVVGMVASTQSIYYESSNGQPKGPLQMVVKNCVPAASIRALLK